MGMLDRITGSTGQPTGNLLGLSSRTAMPRDVAKERDHGVAVAVARGQVVAADIAAVHHVGQVATAAVVATTREAEAAAQLAPFVRDRVDLVADTVAAIVARKVAEAGGQP